MSAVLLVLLLAVLFGRIFDLTVVNFLVEQSVTALIVGAAIVSFVLYRIFKNSTAVVAWLGDVGMLVLTRLMAFILLCIGIQIMWYGWAESNGFPS